MSREQEINKDKKGRVAKKSSFVKLGVGCITALSLLLLQSSSVCATQNNSSGPLEGVVLDSKSQEPMPYVSVWVKGSIIGTMTNEEGKFSLDTELDDNSIIAFSFMGYESIELSYATILENDSFLTIYMSEKGIVLDSVSVKPNNSYARSIMKKIIQNKKYNDPDNFHDVDYKKYDRKSLFLTDLKKSITDKKMFKASADAFITQSDSTVAMPIFQSERHTHYFKNEAGKVQEETLESKDESIAPHVQATINTIVSQKITTDFNFYNNQIEVMSRGFPSPISRNYQLFYNTYLSDSITVDGIRQYKFEFYPRNKHSIAFKGYFWIDSKTYSLTDIYANLPSASDVNFVNGLETHISYQPITRGRWYYKSRKTKSNLSVSKMENRKRMQWNIIAQNVSHYYDIETYNNIDSLAVTQTLSYPLSNTAFEYDSLEIRAYKGISELKENNTIKVISRFSDMTLSGYYNLNKFDLGSYMDIYRNNFIEGHRFTLPLRTSEKMFENFTIGGYVGYGLKSEEIKYGGNIKYMFPNTERCIITLKYDDEYYSITEDKFIEFIRENPYESGSGNIVSVFTTYEPNPYMLNQYKISLGIEKQLNKDIGMTVKPFFNRYLDNDSVQFIRNGEKINSFDNYGILTNFRFSFNQPYDDGFFSRTYYGNEKPVIQASSIFGTASFHTGSETVNKRYLNLNISMKKRFNLGIPFMRTMFNIGYIAGNVPYPLLFTSRGNSDYGVARFHYNLLYNTSFVSDLYTNAHLSLNGGGILLSKIPKIRSLHLREIISFKSFWGQLTGNHESVFDMPDFLRPPTAVPYMEVGAGLTNIFKVVRVEYIIRINQGTFYDQFSSKNGVRLRIEVSF